MKRKPATCAALLLALCLLVGLFAGCSQERETASGGVSSTGSTLAPGTVSDSSQELPPEGSIPGDITVSDPESGTPAPGQDHSAPNTQTTTAVASNGNNNNKPSGNGEYFPVRSGIKGEVKVYVPWALDASYQEYAKEFKRLYPQASVKYLSGEYVNRDVKLSAYIQADNSPDATPSGINDYPKRIIANMIQPIDQWVKGNENVKLMNLDDMKNLLSWKGKMYVFASSPKPSLIYYNKTMFQNEGVKTPLEFYKEGKWNWTNFKNTAQEMTIMDATGSKVDTYGFGTEWEIIFPLAAGTDLLDSTGKLNTANATLRKSLQFYYDMVAKDKTAVPNRWGIRDMFAKNKKVAMFYGYNDPGAIVNAGLKDFEVVPFPKADGQSQYCGHALTGGYAVPVGARNPEGGVAFIETVMNYQKQQEVSGKTKSYYSKEQQARIDSIKTVCTYLDGYGLAVSFDDGFGQEMRGGGDLATLLEKYKPTWQREIDLVLRGK